MKSPNSKICSKKEESNNRNTAPVFSEKDKEFLRKNNPILTHLQNRMYKEEKWFPINFHWKADFELRKRMK